MPLHNGHSPAALETQPELDLRQLIPKLGLTEYWHPAIRDREVGWKKPDFLKMLGQDLCLFRGKSGKVAALANACPHRGAMLADGDCTFRGFESLPAATRAWTTGGVQRPYQDYYPGVDAKWPQTRWRYLWTWFFDILEKRPFKRPYVLGEKWGVGEHLPGMFRQNYWSHVFTRWVVPIDEEHSRVVYFHSMKASNWLQRLWARLLFDGLRNWVMNRNFSEQDARGSIRAYHDRQENLAPSDIQTVAWRRFILTARGLQTSLPADEAASAKVQPQPEEALA